MLQSIQFSAKHCTMISVSVRFMLGFLSENSILRTSDVKAVDLMVN